MVVSKMKFDVFILVYKNLDLIGDLLKSLSSQADQLGRVVISIDSPDTDSVDDVKVVLMKFPRLFLTDIIVRSNTKNLGVAYHVKYLEKYIRSDFILLIGADDYICKNYFKVMSGHIAASASGTYSILTPNQFFVDPNSLILRETSRSQSDLVDLATAIQQEGFGVPSAGSLISSNLIRDIRFYKNTINEDDQIIFRGMLAGKRIIVPERLFFYRVDVNSLSSWHRDPFLCKTALESAIVSEVQNRRAQNLGWLKLLREDRSLKDSDTLINLCRANLRWYISHEVRLSCAVYLYAAVFWFRLSALYRFTRYKIGNMLHALRQDYRFQRIFLRKG